MMGNYLYDPHTHTAETSRCGKLPAAEVVERYARSGFAGLAVTDHLHPEYLSALIPSITGMRPWTITSPVITPPKSGVMNWGWM